ncbi:hypothetical protein DPMN_192326 [Dreissena polymorpha]|uniref:Uncharacterized protein n=1 Tax=Dreissena polymorpha TaxID=45954 RepID=A0A9D3Y3A9_DREPO|nr:hypothetical protein DPMN_192326 [Dreissena polymorpha]
MARTMKIAKRQSKATEKKVSPNYDDVNKLIYTPRNRSAQSRHMSRAKSQSGRQGRKPKCNSICKNCGGKYTHESRCPAQGKEFRYCHTFNHLKVVCRKLKRSTPRVHEIKETVSGTDAAASPELAFGKSKSESNVPHGHREYA